MAAPPPPSATAFRHVRLVGTAFHRRPVGRGVPPSRQVGSRVPRDRVCRRQSAHCAQIIPANLIAHTKSPLTRHLPKDLPPLKQVTHEGAALSLHQSSVCCSRNRVVFLLHGHNYSTTPTRGVGRSVPCRVRPPPHQTVRAVFPHTASRVKLSLPIPLSSQHQKSHP